MATEQCRLPKMNKGPSKKDVRTKSRKIDPPPYPPCPHWLSPFVRTDTQ